MKQYVIQIDILYYFVLHCPVLSYAILSYLSKNCLLRPTKLTLYSNDYNSCFEKYCLVQTNTQIKKIFFVIFDEGMLYKVRGLIVIFSHMNIMCFDHVHSLYYSLLSSLPFPAFNLPNNSTFTFVTLFFFPLPQLPQRTEIFIFLELAYFT